MPTIAKPVPSQQEHEERKLERHRHVSPAEHKRMLEFLDPKNWIDPKDAEPLANIYADAGTLDFKEPPEELYEERIVLFIDLLGFKSKVDNSHLESTAFAEAYKTAEELLQIWRMLDDILTNAITGGGVRVTVFSDSAVVSIYPNIEMFHSLLTCLDLFLRTPSGQSVMDLSRGGIAKGPIYHSSSLVFGPAMIRAYEIESKIAVVPRYVFDESLVEAISSSPNCAAHLEGLDKFMRRDFDGSAIMRPFNQRSIHRRWRDFRGDDGKYLPESILGKLRWMMMRADIPTDPVFKAESEKAYLYL